MSESEREREKQLEAEAGPKPTEPPDKGKFWMAVKHQCNHVARWQQITMFWTRDYHAYRCLCGETVFVGTGRAANSSRSVGERRPAMPPTQENEHE